MRLPDAILAIAAIPWLVASGYLAFLALLSGKRSPGSAGPPRLRFDVIVPAHEEESGIAATVSSLLALDYPRELFRVLVVADNCRDHTAARAREAGAEVLERTDPDRRGKGQALAYAFARSLAGSADAMVVVDADTLVSNNLLQAFALRLEEGAHAIQADYAVRNPDDSWRTLLMAVALGMFHRLRSLARERLGLSCGARGNGMCFSRSVLLAVPHDALSVVEDVEYGIRLGEAGHRVHYAPEAQVYGEMTASASAARTQRSRWEGGRWALARGLGLPLLRKAISRRDPVLLDLAFDLLVPPLSVVVEAIVLGFTASAALALAWGTWPMSLSLWTVCAGAVTLYVGRGWQLSGTGIRGLKGLACAPVYIVWKLLRGAKRPARATDEWVRTARGPP